MYPEHVKALFEARAQAQADWENAEEILICITRRTHPNHVLRSAAEETASNTVHKHRFLYEALHLALTSLLEGVMID